MNVRPPFQSFGKIPRLENLEMTITEKIDGTNACVVVDPEGNVTAQSRRRQIDVDNDNAGFAAWVQEHHDELRGLGMGYHFGEWWGKGIQRGYGLDERRFSLFNVDRWNDETPPPDCCHVVPVVHRGPFSPEFIRAVGEFLQMLGSQAAPEWPDVEGVMVYVSGLNTYIKHPYDPRPKETIT